ncbi:hypothetical protein EVAR_24477_1 [Eumeta japonica]|uniref:Uncharacterized protein n=1 Tax=Eumeta variegata TaxID=151549 RepID=A0A4C1WVC6_EUMVA|nr:hypothetical protein EVAR_24477_1 [Eumeta japonica]
MRQYQKQQYPSGQYPTSSKQKRGSMLKKTSTKFIAWGERREEDDPDLGRLLPTLNPPPPTPPRSNRPNADEQRHGIFTT